MGKKDQQTKYVNTLDIEAAKKKLQIDASLKDATKPTVVQGGPGGKYGVVGVGGQGSPEAIARADKLTNELGKEGQEDNPDNIASLLNIH